MIDRKIGIHNITLSKLRIYVLQVFSKPGMKEIRKTNLVPAIITPNSTLTINVMEKAGIANTTVIIKEKKA